MAEELIQYYDPVAEAVLRVPKSEEANMREAGYTVGHAADLKYGAQGPVATGVAALSGAASGFSFGLSDVAGDLMLPDGAKEYVKAASDAHGIVHGAGQFAGGWLGFGKIGGIAKALGAGKIAQAGTRVAASAVMGGLETVHHEKEVGAPINGEAIAHGGLVGAILGIFGEGAGHAIEKTIVGSQGARTRVIDWLKKRKAWREKITKVPTAPMAESAAASAPPAPESAPIAPEPVSAAPAEPDMPNPEQVAPSDPFGSDTSPIPTERNVRKRSSGPRDWDDAGAFGRTPRAEDRAIENHLRSIMGDESGGLLDYEPGEYVTPETAPAAETPPVFEGPPPAAEAPAPTSTAPEPTTPISPQGEYELARGEHRQAMRDYKKILKEWNAGGRVGAEPIRPVAPKNPLKPDPTYKSEWVDTKDNPLTGAASTLSNIGGGAMGLNMIHNPATPLLAKVGGAAWSLGKTVRALNSGIKGMLTRDQLQRRAFEEVALPAWQSRADRVRYMLEAGGQTAADNIVHEYDVDGTYDALAETIPRMASSPEAVADTVREQIEPMVGNNSEAHSNTVAVVSSAIQALNDVLPKDPRAPALQQTKHNPTRSDKMKVLRTVHAITNPTEALAHPTMDGMQALEKVYPHTVALMREQVASALLHGRKQYSPAQAKRLSVFMGAPLNSGLDPAYIARIQQAAAASSVQPQAAPQRGPGRPPKATVTNVSANAIAAPSQQDEMDNTQ